MSKIANVIKGFISTIWNKFKSGIDLQNGWLPFINSQLKWSFAFSLRIATVILVILAIKYFGVVKAMRGLVLYDALGIKPQSSEVISAPDINYDSDLVSIDDIINMLESKTSKKEKKDETKTK